MPHPKPFQNSKKKQKTMAARHEVTVTIKKARDLKNINWKHGDLRPYAVVWVDQSQKHTTKVDFVNGENPVWEEKLNIKIPDYKPIADCSLFMDIVHDDPRNELRKKIVGSGKLPLLDVLADANNAGKVAQFITLVRPSGRPQGTLEVKVSIKELPRYDPYAPRYGNPAPPVPAPRYGYPSPAYGSAPAQPPVGYGYGRGHGYSGGSGYVSVGEPVKKSNVGLGTGLAMGAVGAVAGILGGLALAEGMEHLEDEIADKAAWKMEEDQGGCYGGGGGGGSYYQPDGDSYYQPDGDSYYQPEGSSYQPDDWSF